MADNNLFHLADYDKAKMKPVDIMQSKGKDNGSSGGEPPRGDELEKRVETLEKAIPDIKERLIRVETKLDSLEKHNATKEDLANLRTDIKGMENKLLYFIGGIFISLAIMAIRVFVMK